MLNHTGRASRVLLFAMGLCLPAGSAGAQIETGPPTPGAPAQVGSAGPQPQEAEALASDAASFTGSVSLPAADIPTPGADALAAYTRGVDLLAKGDPRAAAGSFQLAIARGYHPPARPYFQLGLAYKHIPLRKLKAIRAFREAIRTDPAALDALYEFADTYLSLDGWEAQREARHALIAIMKQDPLFRDAYARWRSLYPHRDEHRDLIRAFRGRLAESFDGRLAALAARLYLEVDDRDGLADLLQDWSRREPRPTSSHDYYRARLLFLDGRDAEATESFHSALEIVGSEADLEAFWQDLDPLLSEADRELAKLRTLGGKVAFIRSFWEARDPLPFSPANERLAEQYRRIREVRRRYLWKKPLAKEKVIGAYIDDLGRPSFDTRVEGRSVDDRGTIYLRHGEPDERHVDVGGGEYWRYERAALAGGRLQFHFKLMDGPMARGNDTVYSVTPTTGIGKANVRRGHAGQEGVENTLLGLQTDTYDFEYGEKILPLATSGATFRNAESRARTDLLLAVGVPLPSIRAFEGEGATQLLQQLRLYDSDYREELSLRDTLRVDPEESAAGILVGAFKISSYPGERRYALQIETLRSGALGLQRGELVFPSYAERGLQLSDVLFASRVSAASADPSAPQREGYAIRPLLSGGLDRTRPLHLYYEVYDLTAGSDGRARYRVEYRVRPEVSLRPGLLRGIFGGGSGATDEEDEVALAFEKERPGSYERIGETISLDLSALPAGRYRIAVSVRDQSSRRETARVVVLELRDSLPGSPPASEMQ